MYSLDTAAPVFSSDWWTALGVSVGVFLTATGLKVLVIALIVAGGFLLAWVARRLINRIVNRIVNGAKSKADVPDTRAIDYSPLAQVRIVQRTRTLGTILTNVVNVAIVIIALILVISVIDKDILTSFTLLSAAIGAGLGFGAQNIVKDVLNGIFIVAEDQVGIGDVVDLGLATGIVESVSVRVTHVRDVNGTLWYVRNGEVTRIGNMSQGWSRVVIDLAVPTDADVGEIEETMLTTAQDLAKDPKWRTRIIEKPEIWGLESVSGDMMVIRLVVKTRPNSKDDVARALRMRLKQSIDQLGVQLPQLNSVTLSGFEGAQSIRGANPPTTKPQPIAQVSKKRSGPKWIARSTPAVSDDQTPDAASSAPAKAPESEEGTP